MRTRRDVFAGLDEKWALGSEMDPGTNVGHEGRGGEAKNAKDRASV